jgi:flagellin-like protein
MVVTRKNDEAVSPVIGVILMVAITVILAAVIAAFVFGMSGNISKTKTVAVTVQKVDAQSISIMNNGGQDGGALMGLNVTSQPPATILCTGTPTAPTGISPCVVSSVGGNPVPVGQTAKIMTAAGGYSGRVQVIVVGLFNDGSNQVLLDTYV